MCPSALLLLFYSYFANMYNLILLFSDHLAGMNKSSPLFPFQNMKMPPKQVTHYFDGFHLSGILSVKDVSLHPFSVFLHHLSTLRKILYGKMQHFYFWFFYLSHFLLVYNIAYPDKNLHLQSLMKRH